MPDIHPTAIVSTRADLGRNVKVGPFVVISEKVTIGEGSEVGAHSVIKPGVSIGRNCTVAEQVVLGGLPQDTRFKGETSYLQIADEVTIREFATVHRATGEGEVTSLGKGTYIMAYVHVSHNCILGEDVTVANGVQLAGHVEVGDEAFLGGSTGVHQFVRVGRLCMVGAHSYLTQDLPPFLVGSGHPFRVLGPNTVGLKRAGLPNQSRSIIKKLYRLLYRDRRPWSEASGDLSDDDRLRPEVQEFFEFLAVSKRGVRKKYIPFSKRQ